MEKGEEERRERERLESSPDQLPYGSEKANVRV